MTWITNYTFLQQFKNQKRVTTQKQGCWSALIFCGSGSSSFSQCGSGSVRLLFKCRSGSSSKNCKKLPYEASSLFETQKRLLKSKKQWSLCKFTWFEKITLLNPCPSFCLVSGFLCFCLGFWCSGFGLETLNGSDIETWTQIENCRQEVITFKICIKDPTSVWSAS